MRKSINGLSVMTQEAMLSDPANGALYLFLNRRRNILKILYWDRNGFCLWQKRLEKHKFPWPRIESHRQELTIAKFEDHLPLYRQERIFKRLGVEIPRTTMSNWLVHIGKRVQPMLNIMHKDMLNSNFVMADETTLQVLKEPGRANTTKSYMWLFRSSCNKERPVLLYKYHPTRSGRVASDLLTPLSFKCLASLAVFSQIKMVVSLFFLYSLLKI